ncbi:hypothetical protein [Anaeromyxobacter paludicola]|uniref:hypothetical protein n=1 Tax=Anaeromyxobacter paludicola TaxID=2918171 RepID=UPI0020C082BD|nr:hypothetical protein [Anaeromyxobacter paludicola]
MTSLRRALCPAALLAAACAHAPPPPLSDPPLPQARLALRAPERITAPLGPTRLAVRLRNEGNRWALLEVDPHLLAVEGRDEAGHPLLCRAPKRARARAPLELRPGASRTLVVHLEDRCAVATPGSYTLLFSYRAPAAEGQEPYEVAPVEVKLTVAPASAPPAPSPAPAPAAGGPAEAVPSPAAPAAPATPAAPAPRADAAPATPAPPASPPGAAAPAPGPDGVAARNACVDRELARRGLNAFGDRPGTVYAGGTPLFDERTGRTADRHEHVLSRQPSIAAACPASPAR